MQVCVITTLKVKRENSSFVIILNIARLIQIQSLVGSTRVVSGPLKTCREHAVHLHTTKGSEYTNVEKEQLSGNSSYLQNIIISRA
jgi:hypothetical protein